MALNGSNNNAHIHIQIDNPSPDCIPSIIDRHDYSDLDAWTSPYGKYLISGCKWDDCKAMEHAFLTSELGSYIAKGGLIQPALPHIPVLVKKPTTKQTPGEPAIYLTKPLRILQNTSKGFFALPRELRNRIIIQILNPECGLQEPGHCSEEKQENHVCRTRYKGCTKFAQLCSKAYEEFSEIFSIVENRIVLRGLKGCLFRRPTDTGLPGHFENHMGATKFYVPPRFERVQVVRFRKLAIEVHFSDRSQPFNDLQSDRCRSNSTLHLMSIAKEVNDLVEVLDMSKNLESVRLILRRCHESRARSEEEGHYKEAAYVEMRKVLRPLIDMAHNKRIQIAADDPSEQTHYNLETDEWDLWTDPLILWFNNAAIAPSLKADFESTWDCETSEQWSRALNKCTVPKSPYAIVPECHRCLTIFADRQQLIEHLATNPSHVMDFRKKTWNVLHPRSAYGGGPRVCPTCAVPYTLMNGLHDHMRNEDHHRYALIPRYRSDNAWYARKDHAWAKKHYKLQYF